MERIISQDFKETEIGPIPKDWEVVRLGDIAHIRGGHSFPPSYQGKNIGDYPFYKVSDMNLLGNKIIMKHANNYILKKDLFALKAKTFLSDTIIFPKVGAAVHTNKKRILSRESIIDNNVLGISILSDVIKPFYLLYFFYTINLSNLSNPGALPSINSDSVKSILVPIPPIPEQKAIANVLSIIQENIEKTEAVINSTKELKKSLMNHLFTYGPVPINETEKVKLKETEVGLIPEDWNVEQLNKITQKTRLIDPTKILEYKFRYIDVSGIDNNVFSIKEYKIYTNIDAPSRARKMIIQDDIIIATVRPTLRRIAIITKEFDNEICSTAFCVLRAKDCLSPLYLYYCLQRDLFTDRLRDLQRGASYPAVTDTDIKKQKIPLPPLPIQKQIADILSAVDSKIEAEKNKARALEKLFQSLLNDLMTGKIRVREAVA